MEPLAFEVAPQPPTSTRRRSRPTNVPLQGTYFEVVRYVVRHTCVMYLTKRYMQCTVILNH